MGERLISVEENGLGPLPLERSGAPLDGQVFPIDLDKPRVALTVTTQKAVAQGEAIPPQWSASLLVSLTEPSTHYLAHASCREAALRFFHKPTANSRLPFVGAWCRVKDNGSFEIVLSPPGPRNEPPRVTRGIHPVTGTIDAAEAAQAGKITLEAALPAGPPTDRALLGTIQLAGPLAGKLFKLRRAQFLVLGVTFARGATEIEVMSKIYTVDRAGRCPSSRFKKPLVFKEVYKFLDNS